MVTTEDGVKKYLKDLKNDIKDHGVFYTLKAQDEISHLGINTKIATEIIEKLEVKDYVSGPETDRNFPKSNVWCFGSEPLTGFLEIYIKFSERKDNQRVICVSFHTEQSPRKHPYKK
jgi:hypothetical protein